MFDAAYNGGANTGGAHGCLGFAKTFSAILGRNHHEGHIEMCEESVIGNVLFFNLYRALEPEGFYIAYNHVQLTYLKYIYQFCSQVCQTMESRRHPGYKRTSFLERRFNF